MKIATPDQIKHTRYLATRAMVCEDFVIGKPGEVTAGCLNDTADTAELARELAKALREIADTAASIHEARVIARNALATIEEFDL